MDEAETSKYRAIHRHNRGIWTPWDDFSGFAVDTQWHTHDLLGDLWGKVSTVVKVMAGKNYHDSG